MDFQEDYPPQSHRFNVRFPKNLTCAWSTSTEISFSKSRGYSLLLIFSSLSRHSYWIWYSSYSTFHSLTFPSIIPSLMTLLNRRYLLLLHDDSLRVRWLIASIDKVASKRVRVYLSFRYWLRMDREIWRSFHNTSEEICTESSKKRGGRLFFLLLSLGNESTIDSAMFKKSYGQFSKSNRK